MEQSPILIIVIPLMAAFLTPLIGLWRRTLCYPWVVLALGLCTLASVATLGRVILDGPISYRLGGWAPPWGIEYVVDHLNALVLTVISGISLFIAISARKSAPRELPGKSVLFYTILLLQVTGLLGIVITGDMFNLYVFLEIASLAGYALIAIGEDRARMASFNYVIMGTVGACFYLLGVGYLYIMTGSLNIADLKEILPQLHQSKVVLVAFAFFLVGVSIKMALFPLHVWLPDAYTFAPSPVSALVAPLMTKVGVYIMIRIIFTVFGTSFFTEAVPASTILGWFGVVAIFSGALLALAQRDLKRMLCYVVVAEVGYFVGGIGCANQTGLTGAILHIVNDALMVACFFTLAGIFMYKLGTRSIGQLKDLFPKMPLTMAAFTVAGLSLIGVPPTGGFFSKWYLILGAIEADNWFLVGALLFSSLVNVVLFFRVVEVAYYPSDSAHHGHGEAHGGGHHQPVGWEEAPPSMLFPLYVFALSIVAAGIFTGTIVSRAITPFVQGVMG